MCSTLWYFSFNCHNHLRMQELLLTPLFRNRAACNKFPQAPYSKETPRFKRRSGPEPHTLNH